jgi:hypothetical protein
VGSMLDGCQQDNRIITFDDLEEAIAKYTPRLFFEITNDKTNEITIAVPEQLIQKIKKEIVPRIFFSNYIKVIERGKKESIKNRFWKWFDDFTR